jgi:hypothetical protein
MAPISVDMGVSRRDIALMGTILGVKKKLKLIFRNFLTASLVRYVEIILTQCQCHSDDNLESKFVCLAPE